MCECVIDVSTAVVQKTCIAKYYRLHTKRSLPFIYVTIRYRQKQVDNRLIPWLQGITQVFTRLPTFQ